MSTSSIIASCALMAAAYYSTGANAYTVVSAHNFMYKNVDPILQYGQYNSHLHTFFGSDALTANTKTSAELRKGCTSAENVNDLSAYWVPTLLYTGGGHPYKEIAPLRFSAYYIGIDEAQIPFPENLKLVAGSVKGSSPSDQTKEMGIEWFCEGEPTVAGKNPGAFPTKTCKTHLQTLLLFPDCVDPVNLSKYAYRSSVRPAACPAGMKSIPQLRFSIRYDVRKLIPKGWNGPPPLALSCGNEWCSHGDFINGWDKEAAVNMLKATGKLSSKNQNFKGVPGSVSAQFKGGAKCTPDDRDAKNGVSSYEKTQKN